MSVGELGVGEKFGDEGVRNGVGVEGVRHGVTAAAVISVSGQLDDLWGQWLQL